MSAVAEAIRVIDERTQTIATTTACILTTQGEQGKDIAQLIKHQAEQDTQITALQLANARLAGQLDMLWKVVLFLGMPGIAGLIRTFAPSGTP
jgi:hypothetical protein